MTRILVAWALAAMSTFAMAQPQALNVIVFPGGFNLPTWAAERQGFFQSNGVRVVLTLTPSSTFQMQGLAEGRFDIAMTALDNVIAYQEGQGEAKIPDNPDMFAFMGSDNGFLSVMGGKGVQRFADLKGKKVGTFSGAAGTATVLFRVIASKFYGFDPGKTGDMQFAGPGLLPALLDKGEIDRMINDATQHAAEDKLRRELVEARNNADSLAYSVERAIKDMGDRVPAHERARAESLISDIRNAIKDESTTIDRLRQLTSDLQQVSHALASAAYGQASAAGAGAGTGGRASGGDGGNDDVIDAEYTPK